MKDNAIHIEAWVAKDPSTVWDCYTSPEHITQWNFASDDWCCPSASNNLAVGGKYQARMEAKDGSFGFDLIATYSQIDHGKGYSFQMEDGREVTVELSDQKEGTLVTVMFEPEAENPIEMQQQGWQGILDNFKKYCDSL
ncbi:SRPBCC domain-containing protein [Reichenbachiella ulvae]|uniref:SRPBCC domain-containing protein n=1 Tax=Reichenbachiella ulvae TaxID=2980104 RepID=A0ABT3CTU6_9BACT|nr:SRPBCC domain-containing protein [Reichenbachiella ulvae]MCV9387093.1 SRPBCC domain-containing protein [Reichenbachiella ulvae]